MIEPNHVVVLLPVRPGTRPVAARKTGLSPDGAVGGVGVGEAPDGRKKLLGGFDLRAVTGSGEQLEPRGRDRAGVDAAVVRVDDLIALSPQH